MNSIPGCLHSFKLDEKHITFPPHASVPIVVSEMERCEKPPRGWWCSRERGHDGPCAAYPVAFVGPDDLSAEDQAELADLFAVAMTRASITPFVRRTEARVKRLEDAIRRVRTVDRPEHSGDLEWHDRMGAALDGLYAALTESEES